MKVLVTGGAGFIGSHIVEKLISENCEVVVVDNLSSGSEKKVKEGAMFYPIDITGLELESIFMKERPQFVIHQAAQVSVPFSMADPLHDSRMNILGTINLLQCCVKYNVQKIIFASTAAVYGIPVDNPINEQHALQPISFYGISKVTTENYIQMYGKINNLNYCILRYANVYGPEQNADGEAGVVSIYINRLLENNSIVIYGDGNQTRDFIYVKDVARACVLALHRGENLILNISSQTQTSINQLVSQLEKTASKTIMPVYKPAREGDIYQSYLENKRARVQLNWQPFFTLETGLKETYEFSQREYIERNRILRATFE